jgi:hypothetical protein
LFFEDFVLQPLPLPDGVVGVLDRKFRERRFLSTLIRVVERREFLEEDAH